MNNRWTFETWFTGFGNSDYIEFKGALVRDIGKMNAQALNLEGSLDALITTLNDFEGLNDRLEHLSNYLHCLFADNCENEEVKRDRAWMATLHAEATKLKIALETALASLNDPDFNKLFNHNSLKGAQYTVERMREEGKHKMKIELEALAADLNVNGLHAWGRLYDTLTSQMKFLMTFPDGHQESIPMARRRALMADPDRFLRQAAFCEGQKPWNDYAEAFAACLNGIAGTRLSLYRHRGISHFLDLALFDSALGVASLEAMLEAIHRDIELPRRALRAAALLQGTPALHYFDLEAPQIVLPEEESLSWKKATEKIDQSFSSAYPELGEYFREMLNNRWIEAEPRDGKLPGAYCVSSRWKQEERVYMSFHGTLHDLVTLAHEVGHAWHSYVLRPKRSFASHYPMTLAETASNFGEMILLNSLMNEGSLSPERKGSLIEQQMLRAHAYLLNIPMRYQFEKAFYTERVSGEVPVSRLCELMTQAQDSYYGDTLLNNGKDPLFWAYKMHFFLTDLSFYNFPYAVGYLLSQALFSRFIVEGKAFLASYEAFLADTGSATCEEVARNRLGVDLRDPSFWTEALRTLEPMLKQYEALAVSKSSKPVR